MVTIEVSIEDISELMGLKFPLTPQELDENLVFAIAEVDSEPDGPDENGHTKIAVEIKTANRPDLWSAEGIARVFRGTLDSPGLPPLDVTKSGYEINVSSELQLVRPYIGAAVVRDLELNDFLIKQMIQIQDKVDFSFGRKRKKTSIGIYNVNMLESPILYTVVDRNFKFRPLQFDEEMTVDEIFEKHPKGIEYQSILAPYQKVPILIDTNQRVLSLPPIINSDDVGRINPETTDVLVEVTGLTLEATNVALSVMVQALRDRGGKIESVKINYPKGYGAKPEITPYTKPIDFQIDPKDINRYLGTKFSSKRMVELLRSRTLEARGDGKKILVQLPPWRAEVLHWVDLSEEIAIAAGYNNLGPTDSQVVTAGKIAASSEDENLIRQILIGFGLIEVLNYTLTDLETPSTMVRRPESWINQNSIQISNPVSLTRLIVRSDLLPGLIRFEGRNTHVEYPHRTFESGECVLQLKDDTKTITNVCVLLCGNDVTFETILSILDSLFRLLKCEYRLESEENHYYMAGRSGGIYFGSLRIGHIGEIHPEILENHGIKMPASALEINLSDIDKLQIKEMKTNES